MKYIEVSVYYPNQVGDEDSGIMVAELSEYGFESFSEEDQILKGYIQESAYRKVESQVTAYLQQMDYEYRITLLENIDWNQVWESNFAPILVDGTCYIRAPFHAPKPECKYDIVIMPKMSFGTGHHATTYLMIREMLGLDFHDKVGADVGCGTGVLSILAVKMGARVVDAIDIDEWAYENTRENIKNNAVAPQISPILGDASALRSKSYHIMLANINRNILLADFPLYVENLHLEGDLLLSGFLEVDAAEIESKARELGLTIVGRRLKDGWALVHCRKA